VDGGSARQNGLDVDATNQSADAAESLVPDRLPSLSFKAVATFGQRVSALDKTARTDPPGTRTFAAANGAIVSVSVVVPGSTLDVTIGDPESRGRCGDVGRG